MGGWTKREAAANLVVLGDDEGQIKTIGGLLADLKQDGQYPSRHNYAVVQKNGDVKWLAGSASLGRQLGPTDVGKFIKCTFMGWGHSANGKFKEIEVLIYEGEVTPEMKAWPKYADVQAAVAAAVGGEKGIAKNTKAAAPAPMVPDKDEFADFPEAVTEKEPDDLPF